MPSFARYDALMAQINDVLSTMNLLAWDARTQMPAAGAAGRGHQVATLTGLARDLATGEAMRAALDEAQDALAGAGADDPRRRAIEQTEADLAVLRRIPQRLVVDAADLRMRAETAWAAARAANDFAGFAPYLEQSTALQRQWAEAIGYAGHPYDALVGQYEPGMTLEKLRGLYAQLRTGLRPLQQRAMAAPQQDDAFLERPYPVEAQRCFAASIAERFGYDFSRGRLDPTVHPFEIPIAQSDVRITWRVSETWLPVGMFAVWHEAGHGLYEQNVDPKLARSIATTDLVNLYAVGGASYGTHESQSRLLENRLGRSHRFWQLHFSELQAAFPEQLADIDADGFWRAVNRSRPSLIRVSADELTYDAHIMMRTEIEASLISGEIEVADLPTVWAERMREDLGVEVPTDREGVLQDAHWSAGLFGTFPTYTIGNVMSSQFFAAAGRQPDVAAGLEQGDYQPLRRWLNQHVHCFGRSRTPAELLRDATGSELDPTQYLADLGAKVDRLAA